LSIIHEIPDCVVPKSILDKLQREEALRPVFWDGQLESTLWIFLQEWELIIPVLTDGKMKFIDGRDRDKALDFDRDLLARFLEGDDGHLILQVKTHRITAHDVSPLGMGS
jgi:hypothetical protein